MQVTNKETRLPMQKSIVPAIPATHAFLPVELFQVRSEWMGCRAVLLFAGLLAAAFLRAQSVEVYSEFQRPDPLGAIVAADRAESPREILSPAVARNGFASFHIAVSVPLQTNYFLYVVTNPVRSEER